MRHNVSRGYVYSRQMVTGGEGALPYIGKWLMSYGSLPSIQLPSTSSGINITALIPSGLGPNPKLGILFNNLINKGVAQEGDIFTVVRIMTSADGAGSDEYSDETLGLIPGFTYTGTLAPGMPPLWSVDQYVVNQSSSDSLQQRWMTSILQSGNKYINFADMGNADIQSARAAAIIITRKTANGLLCSTSQLIWNKAGEDMMSAMASEAWLEGQRKAWNSQNVILAGALV